ncbi:MAG TPA: pantetheine-phosphate adenylyltransferase, partial [Capsulimonadaceae bacterium]|nr:pantetheine-phosphate adenylyltransferase [Capsulimonadaceae bacterium]
LYDKLIVLVASNSSKSPAFSGEQRMEMIQMALTEKNLKNVHVDCFSEGLLVDYVEAQGARVIIKGLRAVSDFEYEYAMALLNRRLRPNIETVFMMTSGEYSFLSSSIVKEIARLGGEIAGLVPPPVLPFLREKFKPADSKRHSK